MAKPWAKSFYNSIEWRLAREHYIHKRTKIDGALCEICKSRLGYIVDHIEELTPKNIHDSRIALSESNFQYLCLSCHNRKTKGSMAVATFDDEGNPILD